MKKKFDDIFEASKYDDRRGFPETTMNVVADPVERADRFTKALDHIKTIRKEQNSSLKVDQERLTHLKVDRDKSGRVSRTRYCIHYRANGLP